MDNFTIAVLCGAAGVILGFILMMVFDKKRSSSASDPAKPAGK